MKAGIIGAMEEEVTLLRDKIENRQTLNIAGCEIYTGTLNGTEVALLKSGIGKVAAAMGATLLLEHCKPDVIINTGSAGGLAPTLKVGDIVVSDDVRYHDADVTAFGYEYGQLPGCPAGFKADRAHSGGNANFQAIPESLVMRIPNPFSRPTAIMIGGAVVVTLIAWLFAYEPVPRSFVAADSVCAFCHLEREYSPSARLSYSTPHPVEPKEGESEARCVDCHQVRRHVDAPKDRVARQDLPPDGVVYRPQNA